MRLIDELRHYADMYQNPKGASGRETIGTDELLIAAANALENLQPQWIPVTERLPEQREDVIMNAFWHENWQPLLGWYSNMNDIWHYEFGGCYHHVQVNAWMPLPEPYKEGR